MPEPLNLSEALEQRDAAAASIFARGVLPTLEEEGLYAFLQPNPTTDLSILEDLLLTVDPPKKSKIMKLLRDVQRLEKRIFSLEKHFKDTLKAWERSTEDAFQLETILRRSSQRSFVERNEFAKRSEALEDVLNNLREYLHGRQQHAKMQLTQYELDEGQETIEDFNNIQSFCALKNIEMEKLVNLPQRDVMTYIISRLQVTIRH